MAATSFLATDIWIPLALPFFALAAAPVIAHVVRYLIEERTRQRIQHAFSHYLSPAIVDRLASDTSALKLGGELREVTVMFADLSGFTALSGKVEPEVLTQMTNQYLGYIVESVEATVGYVDKFIGDAVMAIWGAPVADRKHAVNGIRAAMAAAARILKEKEAAKPCVSPRPMSSGMHWRGKKLNLQPPTMARAEHLQIPLRRWPKGQGCLRQRPPPVLGTEYGP